MPAVPRASLPLFPALCALMLALGLIVQAFVPVATPLPDVGPSRARPPRIAAAFASPAVPNPIIATQTLFTPARRIIAAGATRQHAGATTPTDPFAGSQLLGTARAGGFAVALLRDTLGRQRSIRVGERIGLWRVIGIGRDGVRFAQGATRKTLGVGETAVVQPPTVQTPALVDQP